LLFNKFHIIPLLEYCTKEPIDTDTNIFNSGDQHNEVHLPIVAADPGYHIIPSYEYIADDERGCPDEVHPTAEKSSNSGDHITDVQRAGIVTLLAIQLIPSELYIELDDSYDDVPEVHPITVKRVNLGDHAIAVQLYIVVVIEVNHEIPSDEYIEELRDCPVEVHPIPTKRLISGDQQIFFKDPTDVNIVVVHEEIMEVCIDDKDL
jgi:hypothetical protein